MKITKETRVERMAQQKVSKYLLLAVYPICIAGYIVIMMLKFPDLRLPLSIILYAVVLALGIILGAVVFNLISVGQSMKKVVFRIGIHMERMEEARFFILDRILTEEECEDLQECLVRHSCDHSMQHGMDVDEYDISIPVKEWAEKHGIKVYEDETYENVQIYI